jgi:hypothetical protein
MMAMRVSLRGRPLAIEIPDIQDQTYASETMIKSIAPGPSMRGIEIRGWRLQQKDLI